MDEQASEPNFPLRTGSGPWAQPVQVVAESATPSGLSCDVLVIGAGITGAMTAEALTRAGYSVVIIDKGTPARGSTAASTAMILWEIDTPLVELAALYGFEKAASIYHRSLAAVTDLQAMIATCALACEYRPRQSLYLGSTPSSPAKLADEHMLRHRAELPGLMLDRADLHDAFSIDRPGAIVSPGSAEVDPVMLATGLLQLAQSRGARLIQDEAVSHDWSRNAAFVGLASGGSVEAKHVVLATGYDMPSFVKSDLHRIASTWCFATAPQTPGTMWRDQALLWEDSDPYLYTRTTASGQIVVGGEDEEMRSAGDREAALPDKIARLIDKMRHLWPRGQYEIERSWSAEFGETEDGLPLIGRVEAAPRFLAAYGYGGNGITFSFMASRILTALIDGETRPWFEDFKLDRMSSVLA